MNKPVSCLSESPETGVRHDLDLSPVLPSIRVPTLVLWGEQDQTLRPASFRKLVGLMPNAKGTHARAGHVIHQSEADWFNRQVLEFLRSLQIS